MLQSADSNSLFSFYISKTTAVITVPDYYKQKAEQALLAHQIHCTSVIV